MSHDRTASVDNPPTKTSGDLSTWVNYYICFVLYALIPRAIMCAGNINYSPVHTRISTHFRSHRIDSAHFRIEKYDQKGDPSGR